MKYTITPSEQKVITFAKLRKIAKILSDEPCDIYAVAKGNSYELDFCYGKDTKCQSN